MTFTDFHPGQVLTLGPVSLTESQIIDFARQWDPQPFHTDPEWAANSRWKGLIASGWQTCALTMRTVCEGPLLNSGSIGSPGLEYLKWTAPVRPDDQLTITLTVLDTGVSSSGAVGKLRWQWHVTNQDQVLVLDTTATSLFDLTA